MTDLQEVRALYQITFDYPPARNCFVALAPQLFNCAIKLCDRQRVLVTW